MEFKNSKSTGLLPTQEKSIYGVHVARMFYIENEVRISSAIVKYRDFIDILIKAKIMGLLTLGMVNLMAKYHIGVSS